ncbi:hypothetical protein ILYODFUR_028398 [Ilyodon furcidens]|uniref:Uncharacterized protein n=1 Tax=Ilyodon furcidens TaxID=33524 RepID=A0ABV0SQQ9_9TELE
MWQEVDQFKGAEYFRKALYLTMRLSSSQTISSPHPLSANHPARLRLKDLHSWKLVALQLSFDPPPPHLRHHAPNSFWLPSLLWPPLHHQCLDPGEDVSNPNSTMFIQAHVILSFHVFCRALSTKELKICQ